MFVKTMTPRGEGESRSRLWEVKKGESVDFGRVASYEEVPLEEVDTWDDTFVFDDEKAIAYAVFTPKDWIEPLAVLTNGRIFITDDNNTTLERV